MNKNQLPEYQEVVFGNEAHKKLLEGASVVAKAVSVTMGSSGKSVIIDTPSGHPIITKDGITVARSINLKEKLPRMGANLLKEVASKTNELAGDGSTTSTVLGYAILHQGIKMIATGRSAIGIKKGMDLATAKIIEYLKENAIPVRNQQDIISVGTISANGDKQIGELLAQAISKVGSDGIITIEPAKSVSTTLEVVEGMQFDSGFISPYFITNQEKMQVELVNPLILVTNRKIASLKEIIGLLESVSKQNRSLLIIGDEIEGDALHTMIINKSRNILNVCAIKAPSYGEHRQDLLSDIGVVTGAHVFDSASGISLEKAVISQLGTCKKAIITKSTTTLVGDSTNLVIKEKIEERIAIIRSSLLLPTLDDLHVDKYKKRLAKLSGGIAVIKVGGSTEIEISEKKDRVEDALNATVAAAQEGIVPGGGCALYYAAYSIDKEKHNFKSLSQDELAGIEVILAACRTPIKIIVENTGKSPDVIMNKLEENIGNPDWKYFGYNAVSEKYENLIDKCVIDPVKVERLALEHACSVMGLVLTSDCIISDNDEE